MAAFTAMIIKKYLNLPLVLLVVWRELLTSLCVCFFAYFIFRNGNVDQFGLPFPIITTLGSGTRCFFHPRS